MRDQGQLVIVISCSTRALTDHPDPHFLDKEIEAQKRRGVVQDQEPLSGRRGGPEFEGDPVLRKKVLLGD